jgi:hypothetical protein
MLTLADRSNCRRHLDYPVIGLPVTSPIGGTLGPGTSGYRFFEAFGFLEYRMSNLDVDEEARVTGKAYGAVALVGLQPNLGDTLSVTFSGGNLTSPVTVTVTALAPVANMDNRLTILAQMAQAVTQNATLAAAQITAVSPWGSGPWQLAAVPLAEMGVLSPVAFTITATGTGNIAPQVTAQPQTLGPAASLNGTTMIYGYLNILDGLEGAHAGSSQNLDTKQAAVWYSRANEIGLRMSLYRQWQGMFSDFMGVPINVFRRQKAHRHGAIRYA